MGESARRLAGHSIKNRSGTQRSLVDQGGGKEGLEHEGTDEKVPLLQTTK